MILFIIRIECKDKALNSKYLYINSKITVESFCVLFYAALDKLSIPETQTDIVLDLIRLTLAIENNLPLSFYSILKTISKPEIIQYLVCTICGEEVLPGKKGQKINQLAAGPAAPGPSSLVLGRKSLEN